MVYTYIVTLDAEWESHARTDVMFSPDKYNIKWSKIIAG